MLDWRTPQTEDMQIIREYMHKAGMRSSDAAAANVFLLREKYNTKIALQDGFLFRKYSGKGMAGRDGLAFPLGDGDIAQAIRLAAEDRREKNKELQFIYLTEEQAGLLRKLGADVPQTDPGNSDYLYTAEHLAELSGRENQKKRNRANKFEKTFPECHMVVRTEFEESFCRDLVEVEEAWFDGQEERVDSAFVEREEIYEACNHWDALGIVGVVVYTKEGIPAAMSIASEISQGVYDIHFEKSYGEYARGGGFAFVNRAFAKYLRDRLGAVWINREEDIGLEGLRRAKMAYNPDLLLNKYHCTFPTDL